MNRAEKRRQEKLARKAAKKPRVVSLRPGEQAAGGVPEDYLEELASKGIQLHLAGRVQDAENIYRQILEIDPDHADANHLLGGLACQAGNPAQAIGLISKAIVRAPDRPLYHFNLGTVYQSLERLAEAVDSCRNALALKPDYAEAHFGLGMSLHGLGRLEDATASYRQALAVKPDNAVTHNNLGAALQGLGRMDDAVACFRRAIALDPGYAEAHGNLGNAHLEMGRMEDAVASNRQALVLDPDLVETHSNLGNAFQKLGRSEDAVASYRRAIALQPDNAKAHSNLGNVLQGMGRLEDAAASYRQALAVKPDNAVIHNNLGVALQGLGRMDDAVACFRRTIALQPDFAVAWNNLKSATKAVQYADGRLVQNRDRHLAGLGDAARATGEFAMLEYSLAAFRPHRADGGFHKATAGLPPRDDEDVVIDRVSDADRPSGGPPELSENLIALLHFGRSGTGLLHSLIDGHPEISTLPGIYLRGYFNAGVWQTLSAGGWRELPDRFADMFEVLFDASSAKITPGILGEKIANLGVKEGMTAVGEHRDESLSLDRETFRAETLGLMRRLDRVDPMSFLQIVHAAYEKILGATTHKQTMFYHIHDPENFTKLNFLRYAPDARLLMMVREPIQCCESWLRVPFADNDYGQVADKIINMLFAIDQVPFRVRDSVGVRLEDLKNRPEDTMGALCAWMEVGESPSLYEMTAQGKKWWGDPSSLDYGKDTALSPFGKSSVKRAVGSIFSATDQLVLGTLFYPFSVRFGYREPDQAGFERDLRKIRPLLDGMLDFEKAMAERSNRDHDAFKAGGAYRLLRAGLLERWEVLDELGDYPHMLTPLVPPDTGKTDT
ncbi:MAG: tetratricopeptide repeat protein [Proteobacteria bacterium]|nr:tetratricopeptide repeat protein [Pseudomonadota bacterium]